MISTKCYCFFLVKTHCALLAAKYWPIFGYLGPYADHPKIETDFAADTVAFIFIKHGHKLQKKTKLNMKKIWQLWYTLPSVS